VRALVPGVAALTANFRDGEVEEWLGSRARDWSLLNGLLRAEGVEPDRVVMFARADVLVEGSSSLVATLLFPDERVFLWGAKTDGDFQPATTTKWRQLSDAEIVESCGPLYDAALRLLQEQGETRHL
jgi:hypothetical protein